MDPKSNDHLYPVSSRFFTVYDACTAISLGRDGAGEKKAAALVQETPVLQNCSWGLQRRRERWIACVSQVFFLALGGRRWRYNSPKGLNLKSGPNVLLPSKGHRTHLQTRCAPALCQSMNRRGSSLDAWVDATQSISNAVYFFVFKV